MRESPRLRTNEENGRRQTADIFAEENAPPAIGAYILEGALLVVDLVQQRLVPTHALRYGATNV